MLDKIYLEITNVCNLDCTFCHKTARAKKLMSAQEFDLLIGKLAGKAKYLYFHLMGEPTLHPLLPHFIRTARDKGFLPMITTNGSLLREKGEALLSALLTPHKALAELQDQGRFTELMMRQEELKFYPIGDVWEEFCSRCGVVANEDWFRAVADYEKEVLSKRA